MQPRPVLATKSMGRLGGPSGASGGHGKGGQRLQALRDPALLGDDPEAMAAVELLRKKSVERDITPVATPTVSDPTTTSDSGDMDVDDLFDDTAITELATALTEQIDGEDEVERQARIAGVRERMARRRKELGGVWQTVAKRVKQKTK